MHLCYRCCKADGCSGYYNNSWKVLCVLKGWFSQLWEPPLYTIVLYPLRFKTLLGCIQPWLEVRRESRERRWCEVISWLANIDWQDSESRENAQFQVVYLVGTWIDDSVRIQKTNLMAHNIHRYWVDLKSKDVTYINAKARISAPHEIVYIDPLDGRAKVITFDKVRPYTRACCWGASTSWNLFLPQRSLKFGYILNTNNYTLLTLSYF